MSSRQAELVLDAKAVLGEGAFWHREQNLLYWLDIEGRLLHRFDPETRCDSSIPLERRVGCMVPTQSGSLLLAGEKGIEEFFPETGQHLFLTDPEPEKSANRLNDGKCSPEGRFWFGSLNMERQPFQASFYRMDHDRTVTRQLAGLTNSNGIGWSPDGKTLYHTDTPTRQITAFDYDRRRGEIGNPRIILRFPEDQTVGRPDGMTVDGEGHLWIAHWMGGRVSCWNPDNGQMLEEIRLPVSRVTSAAFGGADLATLYLTTASHGMPDTEKAKEPLAGGLFAVSPGVKGIPAAVFRENF
ncbi:MAG: SMP-30/gluconolactonase/LRE family protein [Planctomycetaceae bacterium]|jgi:sugar lactone lactonase YvrE|nr:SMP-30/gluconolactonase/LRE family protein [Planctomycetaceae bacterium]